MYLDECLGHLERWSPQCVLDGALGVTTGVLVVRGALGVLEGVV